MKRLLLTAIAAVIGSPAINAHEEPFNYLRNAGVEARGEWEVEQWFTARLGKESGRYTGIDFSTELEYGFTDRLQGAVYLNGRYHDIENAKGGHETFDDREGVEFDGVSGEIKYQIADAYRCPWGFAVYAEPGWSRIARVSGEHEDSVFFEVKGIVEKHFFDHRLISVFNYTIEPEWENEPGGDWETELEMEWSLGASWLLSDRWRVGLETRFDTEFEDADPEEAEFSSLSIGPNVHFSADDWFATFTVLPQVWGWRDAPGTGGRHLDDREQIELRLKFGFEF